MNNRNKTTRTVLRWTHLLVGFLIGVFVYTPARDDEAFVLLMQVTVVPAVTLTGVWMWQQARIRRLYRRPPPKSPVWRDRRTKAAGEDARAHDSSLTTT